MAIFKNIFSYIKNIFQKRKMFFYFSIFIILALLLFFVFLISNKNNFNDYYGEDEGGDDIFLEDECLDDCSYRLIDGMKVDVGEDSPFLISAIIDNHNYARPQFGLSSAPLVYDIPAEGGINRYLAFFPADLEDVSEVGPIRSARPYFLDIASEHNSLLLHCGGSPDALARIIKERLLTLNEFYNENYFRRYSGFRAPHNILANFSKIYDYLINRELINSKFEPWKFKDGDNSWINDSELGEDDVVSVLELKNGQSQYDILWAYDFENNNYSKKIAGKNHVDDSGQIIKADNLVFHDVKTRVLDAELRLEISLLGRGDAIICLDGKCFEAYWEKIDKNSRTFYYHKNSDEEFIFNRGKTWIHFLDSRAKLKY